MKIILSPAKKMIVDTDNIAPVELPAFIDKTAEILSWIKRILEMYRKVSDTTGQIYYDCIL